MITKKDVSELNIKLSILYPYVFVCRYAEGLKYCKGIVSSNCGTLESAIARYRQLLECKYIYSEFKAFHVSPDRNITEVRFELIDHEEET